MSTAATQVASFRVVGLDCADEVAALRAALSVLPGVGELSFDLLSAKLTVRFDPQSVQPPALLAAVATTGMRAQPWHDDEPVDSPADRRFFSTGPPVPAPRTCPTAATPR